MVGHLEHLQESSSKQRVRGLGLGEGLELGREERKGCYRPRKKGRWQPRWAEADGSRDVQRQMAAE
eukprot:5032561-Pleurochrysis_carterae.AAC.1